MREIKVTGSIPGSKVGTPSANTIQSDDQFLSQFDMNILMKNNDFKYLHQACKNLLS